MSNFVFPPCGSVLCKVQCECDTSSGHVMGNLPCGVELYNTEVFGGSHCQHMIGPIPASQELLFIAPVG